MNKVFIIITILSLAVISIFINYNNEEKDFVSDLKLDQIYNNQISIDFAVLGIIGDEHWEHYEKCSLLNLSLYSYDTIWNIHHLSEKPENQKNPRIAFLNTENFHLMDFEVWDREKQDLVSGPYIPFYAGYDYYIGNGFAFDTLNEIIDYNNDGYLDMKIKFTKLDYDPSHRLIRSLSVHIFTDYQQKIENGELDTNINFNDYEKDVFKKNNNFGYWGIGYITKFSKNGLLHFFNEEK